MLIFSILKDVKVEREFPFSFFLLSGLSLIISATIYFFVNEEHFHQFYREIKWHNNIAWWYELLCALGILFLLIATIISLYAFLK